MHKFFNLNIPNSLIFTLEECYIRCSLLCDWYEGRVHVMSHDLLVFLVSHNFFRVLVFYDDGFAQYTALDKIHLVCESGM